ncbi:MAG: twin-arginine translocase TatA/TatE family subunit [Candidatus Omnitrophica bacterium]|nr:twin-arginine translocase TatA/TatE family subunit [Candidatus Omnitrophota bacterium]
MGEWGVILILVLVLFGGKNIPDLAKALGKGIREFKRAANAIGDGSNDKQDSSKTPPPQSVDTGKSLPPPSSDQ